MAQKCGHCGSGRTEAQFDRTQCLDCGSFTRNVPPPDRGRVDNPDGEAHYHGDDGVIYG